MPQSPKLTKEELDQIYSSTIHPQLPLSDNKYVIFSDMHLGDGKGSDNFVHNEKIVIDCLEYYRKKNFKLILLGDIEDFWQVKIDETRNRYNDSVYKKIREFGNENVFRIAGNHDEEWGKKQNDYKGDRKDPAFSDGREFGSACKALKLTDENGKTIILLLHGQQGSIESQMFSWFSKFIVWGYGKIIEPIFGTEKSNSEPNTKIDSNFEQVYYKIALEKKAIIITGHSHYAIFASMCYADKLQKQINELQLQIKNTTDKQEQQKLLDKLEPIWRDLRIEKARKREITPTDPNLSPKPCYFNSGCCLYESGVTCIELENDNIKLVKWNKDNTIGDYGYGKISDFYKELQS